MHSTHQDVVPIASAIRIPALPLFSHLRRRRQAHFRFELPDLKQSFGVLRFRGSAALSQHFSYRNHIESADPIDIDPLLGTAGRLTVEDGGPRAGLVERVEYLGPTNSGHEYVFVLESPLAVLKHTLDSRVWVDQSLVIEAVLKPHGITGEKLKQNLKGEYRPFEQVVQYNESDFDFFARLAGQARICFRGVARSSGLPHRGASNLQQRKTGRDQAVPLARPAA